jgi:hypothetical protein
LSSMAAIISERASIRRQPGLDVTCCAWSPCVDCDCFSSKYLVLLIFAIVSWLHTFLRRN